MRYKVKKGTLVKTYAYLSDFIRDKISDEDVVEFINNSYADTYPLPPMLSKVISLGDIMRKYLSPADWIIWYDDLITITIDVLEEELAWTNEDKDGVKTINWKEWTIQMYK